MCGVGILFSAFNLENRKSESSISSTTIGHIKTGEPFNCLPKQPQLARLLSSIMFKGPTNFLWLRLIVHGIPLLSLLAVVRDRPLALSKLLRLSVRHICPLYDEERVRKEIGCVVDDNGCCVGEKTWCGPEREIVRVCGHLKPYPLTEMR
jgi:hypothetical protein